MNKLHIHSFYFAQTKSMYKLFYSFISSKRYILVVMNLEPITGTLGEKWMGCHSISIKRHKTAHQHVFGRWVPRENSYTHVLNIYCRTDCSPSSGYNQRPWSRKAAMLPAAPPCHPPMSIISLQWNYTLHWHVILDYRYKATSAQKVEMLVLIRFLWSLRFSNAWWANMCRLKCWINRSI